MKKEAQSGVLVTVQLPLNIAEPSIEDVAHVLSIPTEEIDANLGIVSINPAQALFVIRTSRDIARQLVSTHSNAIEYFEDPDIHPFDASR